MTKRPGDKGGDPGGNAEKRRRLFEESRGLEEGRLLDLDEAASEEESEEQSDEGGAPPADKD